MTQKSVSRETNKLREIFSRCQCVLMFPLITLSSGKHLADSKQSLQKVFTSNLFPFSQVKEPSILVRMCCSLARKLMDAVQWCWFPAFFALYLMSNSYCAASSLHDSPLAVLMKRKQNVVTFHSKFSVSLWPPLSIGQGNILYTQVLSFLPRF